MKRLINQGEVWQLPTTIDPAPDYRCVILRIPNEPEYIKAFYDSYDSLCRWLSWEKRGDNSAAAAAQLFRRYAPIWAACDVVDAIGEDGNMAITINLTTNCNCGGGGVTVNVPVQVDASGQPVDTTCLPVLPNDPTGQLPLSGDDIYEGSPPAGWDNWENFVDARCILANYSVDNLLNFVTAADNAENSSSVIVDVLGVLLLLLPTPLGKLGAPVKLLKLIEKLKIVKTAAENAIDDGEQINDYIQTLGLFIQENKETAVCFFHSAYGPTDFQQKMTARALEWFGQTPGLPEWYKDLILDFYGEAFWQMFDVMATKAAYDAIESGYVATVDCAACDPVVVPTRYVATNQFVQPATWRGGAVYIWNDGNPVGINGQPAPAVVMENLGDLENLLEFTGNGATVLASKTSSSSNHLSGQLRVNDNIEANYIVSNLVNILVGGFTWLHLKAEVAGEIIFDGKQTAKNFKQYVFQLPTKYPAGTIMKISLTCSASFPVYIGDIYFFEDYPMP